MSPFSDHRRPSKRTSWRRSRAVRVAKGGRVAGAAQCERPEYLAGTHAQSRILVSPAEVWNFGIR